MTLFKLTFRSAVFYRRTHALTLAGTMLAAAVLTGALLVGDSIKLSLTHSALLRLGKIHWALDSRNRFFPADLADRLQTETGNNITPALLFRGIALSAQGPGSEPRQINNIQILGVQDSFWNLATGPKPALTLNGIAINEKLATELHLRCGDPLSIRFSKPSLMSRDAPLSSQEKNDTLRGTFTVESIVQDTQLGRFNLAANQQSPCTVFVNLSWLQQTAGLIHQANLLLAGGNTHHSEAPLNQAISKVWRLEDAGLTLRTINNGQLFQLECNRIFMDPSIGAAVSDLRKSVGALTYLVNSITRADGALIRETPYSFVVALSPGADSALGLAPPEMKDDEIIINRWLADHLAAHTGDSVQLTYYTLNAWNKFTETNRIFTVRSVAEMSEFTGERELSPNFPGLTDAGKCAEWAIGMPLKKDKIEDPSNEAYWNEYRATPKAVITLKAGQEMWANPFGNLTALRFRANEEGSTAITEVLLEHLNPTELGLTFLPIRQSALKAAEESMDFGQLFLGMSFFLIVASLMLTGLLFSFGLQQRSDETGVLLAVGFQSGQIRRLWLQECILISAVGSIAGAFLGTVYTQAMIWGLSHFWQGAVAHATIQYHATSATMITGTLLSFVFATGALIFTIRRHTSLSAQHLFSGECSALAAPVPARTARGRAWIPCVGIAMALGLILQASLGERHNPAAIFFAAGSLLLISLLGLARLLLIRLARTGRPLTPLTLGLRNAGRHLSRSLTVATLLACGCFLIFAVAGMQEDIGRDAFQRNSGTGGFAVFGDSALPIQADLNSPEGRKRFNLDQLPDLTETRIVSMKVRDGDDASCLNLNRAQSPTLIGVDPVEFEKRGAFQASPREGPLWSLLNDSTPDGILPGLAGDANTAQWGLKKKTGRESGDILVFRDERGVPFRVKLVGALPMNLSVFQGSVLISDRAFASHYPSENGARMFLIDTPRGTEPRAQEALTLKLGKWGVNFYTTTERLNSFYAVESSYMAMFLLLGGLGMLLGSAGMTIVVLRNIQERRTELALLSATGYSDRQVLRVVLAEYGIILGIGLAAGITASLTAIWPGLHAPGVKLPGATLAFLICGIIISQLSCILLTTRLALRAPLLQALRAQ